jgi:MoaA/NifB/PqqE/SkfB family radical SAM enzyme
LACRHCRAEAIPHRNPKELSTTEAFRLVDAIAECGKPVFVLTGGDPFMRDDLAKIVEFAVFRGLRTAVSPSATGRLKDASLEALARAGCHRISLSIDAATAAEHDAFRGVKGSFARTLDGVRLGLYPKNARKPKNPVTGRSES